MTLEQFTAQRVRKLEGKPEKESPENAAEPTKEAKEEAKEESKDSEAAAPETPKEKEVLSKDLDDMSEAEIRELAEKLGSRAVARFGELTAKRKHAEEQLAALKAQMQQPQDPLAYEKSENNPYSEIKSLPELQAKAKELDEVIEWAEDALWSADNLSADDVVTQVNGNNLTKGQIRKALRDAQKSRKDHLPKQLAALRAESQRASLKGAFDEAARKELNWLGEENNELTKQYKSLMSSPVLAKAMKATPDLAPYMDYMVAHATNSIYGRKGVSLPDKIAPAKSITPPSNPGTTSAPSERQDTGSSKAEKEAVKRFNESSSMRDYVAMRAQQIAKRQKVSL